MGATGLLTLGNGGPAVGAVSTFKLVASEPNLLKTVSMSGRSAE